LSRYSVVAALAILTATLAVSGQAPAPAASPAPQPPSTPSADVLRSYNGLKGNILKAADKMPAENYSYRPTPEVRTFARVVNHVTEAQFHSCGAINGTTQAANAVPPETADKATIVTALQASFAECDKAFAGLTETNMLETFKVGPVQRARISLSWGTVSHDNEQYATLALYMRLKGLAPPSSEK
jgi:uncharacterized damage-inducible protein DinB